MRVQLTGYASNSENNPGVLLLDENNILLLFFQQVYSYKETMRKTKRDRKMKWIDFWKKDDFLDRLKD